MTDPEEPSNDEETGPELSRRTVFAAALLGLAGCMGDGSSENKDIGNRGSPTTDQNVADQRAVGTPGPPPIDGGSSRHAQPGEVQEAINDAADGRTAMVTLQPGSTYDPDSTWVVKSGVTLDYNGAHVKLSRDIDLHDIQPGGQVVSPVVDVRDVFRGFSSSVFVFDSERYGFYGPNRSWHVWGGITYGRYGEGTIYEFKQGNLNSIYFVHADHAVWNTGTVLEMHRSDRRGINGNRIFGTWRGFERGIHMYVKPSVSRNINNLSGNQFDVITQPRESTILWDMEVGRYNVLKGQIWDSGDYTDVVWRIHGGEGSDSRLGNILYWFPNGGSKDELLGNNSAAQKFDDQTDNDMNRIVVPWWLGDPVSAFTG